MRNADAMHATRVQNTMDQDDDDDDGSRNVVARCHSKLTEIWPNLLLFQQNLI